jgi:hypothetical protein
MSDFVFVKGSDLVIKFNGEVIGGVQKVVCSTKKTFSDIKEFLTDIPVARVEENRYQLVMTLNIPSLDEIKEIESIEICHTSKRLVYTKCNIDETQTMINAKGNLEYKMMVSSEKREIYDN